MAKALLVMAATQLALQGGLWLLARGLGRRLRREVMLIGLPLPWVLLGPWLLGSKLLVPSDILARQLPSLPELEAPDPHAAELNDVVFQLIPWELEVRHALRHHRLPLWSNLLDGGSSPWVNPQAEVLSPLAMLARLAPIQHHFLVLLALKVLVGFEGAWLLARSAGVRRFAALLAGAGFALGGGVIAWGLFPLATTAAWIPWGVAGAVCLARRPTLGAVVATALVTAAVLLSGHPEVALGGGLLAVITGLALARRSLPARYRLGAPLLAGLLGCGLAGAQLVPFARALPASQRAQEHLAAVQPADHDPAPTLRPGSWFHELRGTLLYGPASPAAYGRPYRDPFRGPISWSSAEASYAGLVAFACCCAAMVAAPRRRLWPFLGYALGALLLAADFLPLYHLQQAVPILRLPECSRFLPVVGLALAVSGALGVDALLAGRHRLGAVAALAVALGLSLVVSANPPAVFVSLLIAAAALLLPRARQLGAAALAVAAVADLLPWAQSMLPRGDARCFFPPSGAVRAIASEVAGGGRVVGQDLLCYPSSLSVYGLADVRPHNPMARQDYLSALAAAFAFTPSTRHYVSSFLHPEHPLFSFLGGRVVVSNANLPRPPGMVRIDHGEYGIWRLCRNPHPLPRCFFPDGVTLVPPAGMARWIAGLRDPRQVAIGASEARDWRPPQAAPGGMREEVRTTEMAPGVLHLDLPAPSATGRHGACGFSARPGDAGRPGSRAEPDRLVATSLTSPEGWEVQAEGGACLRIPRRITVDGAFVGVLVPPHVRRLRLRFRPPGLLAGLALTCLSAASLLGLAVAGHRRRGNKWPRSGAVTATVRRGAVATEAGARRILYRDLWMGLHGRRCGEASRHFSHVLVARRRNGGWRPGGGR
jgi:hypothetical protein